MHEPMGVGTVKRYVNLLFLTLNHSTILSNNTELIPHPFQFISLCKHSGVPRLNPALQLTCQLQPYQKKATKRTLIRTLLVNQNFQQTQNTHALILITLLHHSSHQISFSFSHNDISSKCLPLSSSWRLLRFQGSSVFDRSICLLKRFLSRWFSLPYTDPFVLFLKFS